MIALTSLVLLLAVASANPLKRQAARVPVSTAVWNDLVHYAAYTRASRSATCATPPHGSVQVQYFNNADTDTQAAIFRDDARGEFILAFPGSDSAQDWETNFDYAKTGYNLAGVSCSGCEVHNGWQDAWRSIAAGVESTLQQGLASNAGYTVSLSGHSLGGALSEIAYGSLRPRGFNVRQLYTYGAPRAGNPTYANYIDRLSGVSGSSAGNIFRSTHADDGVPRVPGTFLGFRHPQTEYWQTDDASGNPVQSLTYRCFGQEAEDCNFGEDLSFTSGAHSSYAGFGFTC